MTKRPLFDLIPRNSEIHNFTSVQLTDGQSRVLGMGLKFRPSLRPPSVAQFDLKINASVGEFAFKISSPIVYKTRISTPDFTSQLAGIHREKTQNLKTNSSLYARSYAITSQLTYRTGRTILQNRSEKNCHIVKSRNRSGMKAVLMLLTLAKSFYLFIVDISPLT